METVELLTPKYFEEIYVSHYTDVYRYIFFKLYDDTMAEDLAQEVFVKAWNARKSFQGRSSCKTWLLKIACNHLNDYFRSAKPALEMDDSFLSAVSADDPEKSCIAMNELKEIATIVHSMPSIYREAFVLVRYNGMSYADAAEALDISLNLLKTRIHRAHRMLTDKLSGGLQ